MEVEYHLEVDKGLDEMINKLKALALFANDYGINMKVIVKEV